MTKLKVLTTLFIAVLATSASAQRYDYVQQGEFGITAGAAHYFGDINTRAALNRHKACIRFIFP